MDEQIDDTSYEDAMAEMQAESKLKNKKKKIQPKQSESHTIDIEDRERALLSQLMQNQEMFIKSIAFLEPTFFESKVNKIIVSEMIGYYEDYKQIPTEDIILLNTGLDDTRHDWLDVKNQWPQEYLENHLNKFIKNMSMKGAIEESIELLEEEDYGTIEKKIKDAVNVDIDVKLGVTVDSDKQKFRELFEMLTSTEATIPTGWYNADDALEGGVTVPSLNYLMAKSGGGKCHAYTNKITVKMTKELYNKLF